MKTTTEKTPLANIEFRAKQYADALSALSTRVQALQAEMDRVRKRHLNGIIEAAGTAGEYQAALRQEVEQHPELFVKPRTVVIHGIQVGFQKGKGKLTWDDDQKVVTLIRKHCPEDQAAVLICTVEKPAKNALLALDAATLKKIGCTIEDAGDQVVVKDTAGDTYKLVQRFLDEAAKTPGPEEKDAA